MSDTMIVDAGRDPAALHRLGAECVIEIREDGLLTGYEVRPEIDLSDYDATYADVLKLRLLAYAADVRFRKETGGIEVAGSPIATDRESQAMISGAFSLVQAQPDTTIRFKTPSGFVTLTAAQMSAIAVAVAQHVQACFALEADVAGDIEAGEISSIEQVDAAFA